MTERKKKSCQSPACTWYIQSSGRSEFLCQVARRKHRQRMITGASCLGQPVSMTQVPGLRIAQFQRGIGPSFRFRWSWNRLSRHRPSSRFGRRPIPRAGVLKDDLAPSLYDACGHRVPLQTTPLAHWPDRSVKWLLLDFMCGLVVEGQSTWSLPLKFGEPLESHQSERRLRVEKTEQGMIVKTGSASFTLDRVVLAPILQAEIDRGRCWMQLTLKPYWLT